MALHVTLTHFDHLGSVVAITDTSDNFVERFSYDPWGQRRDPNDWSRAPSSAPSIASTDRGFTGHEMLDSLGLVHMNGRIYDAQLGVFLSPDPNVQFPDNLQSYNRYSYVLNNPLSYTDPSGYFLSGLKKFFKKFWKPIVAIVVGVVTAGVFLAAYLATLPGVTFSLSTGFGALFGGGAVYISGVGLAIVGTTGMVAAGAVGGFFAGLVATGSLTGAAWGALGGAITAGIGSLAQNMRWTMEAKALAHGLSAGVVSELQGGKFGASFLSAGFASYFGGSNPLQAAVVGGTASVIGGGKFENGAVTGAFNVLFNDILHGEGGSWWKRLKETTHIALDVAGLVPVIGNVADLTNAAFYALEGDGINAGISLAGSIPGGQAATGTRLSIKAAGAITEAALKRKARNHFRKKLIRLTGSAPANSQAHHIFPVEFVQVFNRMGIDIGDAKFGTWWDTAQHQAMKYEYNDIWRDFLSVGNRSYDEVIQFGKEIAETYGLKTYF